MAQGGDFITLGQLLAEQADSEEDDQILDRIKILAQEYLPTGWIQWEVCNISKEEVFGDMIESNVLNKLMFALPTVGIVRAFNPDADHLSEKGYKEMRCKLLDWAFARALIIGPPAIANRIRGSAARTELFKQCIEGVRPLLHTRVEADKILSGSLSESEETSRKRRSTSVSLSQAKRPRTASPIPCRSQDNQIELLEEKMQNMFALLLEKIESHSSRPQQAFSESDSDKENSIVGYNDSNSESSGEIPWKAPSLSPYLDAPQCKELEFVPRVKEADPPVPEPNAQLAKEGIESQRFGSLGWNRIRYKEAEKHLQAAPVFSALKVNTELASLSTQPSYGLAKQDGILGTITHGLLMQSKAIAEGLNEVMRKCPSASEELRKFLANESDFRKVSDQLLQFVCAHRAETIELRRKAFTSRNDILNNALHSIPPSHVHLFEERQLSSFIKENGGLSQIVIPNKIVKPFRKQKIQHSGRQQQRSLQHRPVTNRASTTTQNGPNRSTRGQVPSARRPKQIHHRQEKARKVTTQRRF